MGRRHKSGKTEEAQPRRGKLISVQAEDIFNKPLTGAQKALLFRIAERQSAGDDSGIVFGDVSQLTEEQLANMVRLRDVKRKVT